MNIFFLSYINRSGSSFIAQQLSKYDDIFVFPEGDALIDEFLLNSIIKSDYLIKLFSKDNKLKNWNITADEISTIAQKYHSKKDIFLNLLLTFKNKYKPDANILIFKKRDGFIKHNKLKENLSIDIKLISIIRDPRAIFISQKNALDPYSKKPFNINPLITAYYWNFYLNKILTNKDNIIIKYEDFVQNTVQIVNVILDLISSDKKISNKNVSYLDLISESEKKLHSNIDKEPQPESIYKWKQAIKPYELSIISKICKNNLLKQNYETINGNLKLNYFWYLYFKLRIFFKIDIY